MRTVPAADRLAVTFSPERADITACVIDVSAGDKIPRTGGPGIARSALLAKAAGLPVLA